MWSTIEFSSSRCSAFWDDSFDSDWTIKLNLRNFTIHILWHHLYIAVTYNYTMENDFLFIYFYCALGSYRKGKWKILV